MFILTEFLTNEHGNEHVLEHSLLKKKIFSAPKIYTANGDLKKRWHVYYSYRHPETGKLQRMKNIYGNANRYETKEDRLAILSVYRMKLLSLLKEGFNPFEDNTQRYQQREDKRLNPVIDKHSEKEKSTAVKELEVAPQEPVLTYREAFEKGLKFKEKLISDTTKRSYENRLKNFLLWVEKHYPNLESITAIDKKLVMEFLNHILDQTSARNRNNYRTDLSSIMQALEDNDIIASNFIKKIPVLKSIPQRNKTYSKEEQEAIFEHLEETDKTLLLFIKFISYNFLRPIEVCRLRVGDLDITNKRIQFKAKNSPLKTKIIPDLLLQDLPDLSKLNKRDSLFTPDGIGGNWESELSNKRDYFSKRFKRVVKDKFNLGADYGLYSFRHTYITKLYRELVKGSSPFEAKSKLMQITGHSSMKALEKYLRDIDAEFPDDYSELIKS
ncbi:tyrosine-type recombinase/integrase [Xanthomarina sp. F2636L]|uniref:tyrosine-type recombinase/integrase n=1 Tax=Xanthomarina sp. F2636L TaxID=2996018 RepID=UPI00225DE30E|nr:site-specific integrase [Xanthomarina sp. F2636L]MCX7551841.1 site-specific integrase [Xanthomarina sp. F2636L]